jgi:tetratricopeptide (TPR) repeat protein
MTDIPARDWIERWVLPNRRAILAGVLVLLLLAAAGGGFWFWQEAQDRHAAAAYAPAMARLGAARGREIPPEVRATAIRELEAALQSYPSATMAAEAAFELAGLRFADRQYAPARSAYDVARARSSSTTLRTLAQLGTAATWEAERNFARAIESYQAALAELKPGQFQYEETLVALARAYELANRKDDAIQAYRRLLTDVPKTTRAEDVRARLASLGATP